MNLYGHILFSKHFILELMQRPGVLRSAEVDPEIAKRERACYLYVSPPGVLALKENQNLIPPKNMPAPLNSVAHSDKVYSLADIPWTLTLPTRLRRSL